MKPFFHFKEVIRIKPEAPQAKERLEQLINQS